MNLNKDEYFEELKKREKKWKMKQCRNKGKKNNDESEGLDNMLRIAKEKNPRNIMQE